MVEAKIIQPGDVIELTENLQLAAYIRQGLHAGTFCDVTTGHSGHDMALVAFETTARWLKELEQYHGHRFVAVEAKSGREQGILDTKEDNKLLGREDKRRILLLHLDANGEINPEAPILRIIQDTRPGEGHYFVRLTKHKPGEEEGYYFDHVMPKIIQSASLSEGKQAEASALLQGTRKQATQTRDTERMHFHLKVHDLSIYTQETEGRDTRAEISRLDDLLEKVIFRHIAEGNLLARARPPLRAAAK